MQRILLILLVELSIFCDPIFATDLVKIKADVCIVGAGSAGIGAALAASRAGAKVVLIEKEGKVGGTSTMSYVNSWEPGPGCSFSEEIYHRMSLEKGIAGIARNFHSHTAQEPYMLFLIDSSLNYYNTLRRAHRIRIPFDVDGFDSTVQQMLKETGKCQLLLNTTFKKANATNFRVESIEAESSLGETYLVDAKVFIDCSGSAILCRNVGAEVMVGADAKSRFNEPAAPDVATNTLNGISLCYQIKPSTDPNFINVGEPADFNYAAAAWVTGPVGREKKLTFNPYGILDGELSITQSRDSLYEKAKKIIDKQWAKLRTYPYFKNYVFDSYAPELGIRESYRVVCEYILTQNDLIQGYPNQTQSDFIALADHPMDIHGKGGGLWEIKEAYGIPYRSLIPKGWNNLLVAGKCAGFSHLAASSCRLSRTMMALGHAAGFAASISATNNITVSEVPIQRIQAEMNLKLGKKEDMNARPQTITKFIGKNSNSYLISDNGNGKIYILNANGDITWEHPVSQCQDVQQLPNGNILFTYYQKNGDVVKGGVCEITPEKKEVFRYEIDGEVHSCQRLKNGNTLLTDNNNARLIEVNPQKEIVKSLSLNTKVKGHSSIRMVRVLENGNYLVCQEEDKLVVEYRPDGKMVNSFPSPGKCFAAIRLKNGNTLISDGSACSVREVNSKGKEVWKISKDDFPELKLNWLTGIQELPNGNYLICNWLGHGKYGEGIPMFEVTKNEQIVWFFTDNQSTKSLTNVTPIK
jgi:hypothetical protein